MKVYIICIMMAIGVTGYGQTKILFDASKAETANNADWVIDADQFNLRYHPNAQIGGNEANAQRIPTPSQASITPSTTQDYWTGALSAWAVDAVKLGYEVETLPYNGSISYGDSSNSQDLSNYDVFVVCEPNILFTASEKIALMNFVQNGGGLFMISDHNNSDRNGDQYDSPHIWNDFMQNNSVQSNAFGINFDYEFFTETTTNIPVLAGDPLLHGTYGNVSIVEFHGGTSMTLNPVQNASVQAVVYRTGYNNTGDTGVLCAYASYGQGRVVALGDSSPPDDGTGDTGDHLYDGWIEDANGNHERLIMNATIWLAGQSASIVSNDVDSTLMFYPTIHSIYIKSNRDERCNLLIINAIGQTLVNKHIVSNKKNDVQLNKNALYFYQIYRGNKIIKVGKFVLE